jgi:DNA-binding transcriptional ArsR family regulator
LAVTAATDVFRAVSDPTRRRMLDLLRRGERSVAELAQPFAISQPAVSQHLKVLREAGVVRVRKQGRLRIYRLDPRPLRDVFQWAQYYEQFWREKLAALGRELDRTP